MAITEEDIKEGLSECFFSAITTISGYNITIPKRDYSVDMKIHEVASREQNDKNRFYDTGREIDIQLKCTIYKKENVIDGKIKYSLNVNNYNDLILRRKSIVPLILVLFLLPEEKSEWIDVKDNEIALRKFGFWYVPDSNELSDNKSNVTIKIPLTNKIDKNTIAMLFNRYG